MIATKNFPNDSSGNVLVVDDHARARESMADILRHAGHDVTCCSSAVEALKTINAAMDVVITDLRMPGMTGLEFMRELNQQDHDVQVAMVTAHGTVATAVEAMRYGAFDFIEKPFNADQLEGLVRRALDSEKRSTPLDDEVMLVGDSPAMQELRQRIDRVAPTDETVLITGESGTGKELVAKSLHCQSQRNSGPLVSLNCPALSPHLMESELFGHERGAFTSADAPRIGRFELAHKGSFLLDEVTEISPELQAKLLRVLQERCFERVGSSESRHTDVRVLATTNRNLVERVQEGKFREDLYFRLAVLPMQVPPLRQRQEDITLLRDHFEQLTAERLNSERCTWSDNATDLMLNYHWPGNVRELENLVTRASVLCSGRSVSADDLTPWLMFGEQHNDTTNEISAGVSLQEMERKLIIATLDHYEGHRENTAKAIGIGVRTLCNKLRAYGYAPRAKTM